MLREDRTTGLSALLFALLSLAGCAAPVEGRGEDLENISETDEPITRGTLVHHLDPVAVKMIFSGGVWCSGTKIGAQRFLTAAHCLDGVVPNSNVMITNEDSGTGGGVFTITNVHIYPTQPANLPSGHATDIGMIDVQQESPGIPVWTAIRAEYVPDDLPDGWVTAFGCDLDNPSNGGKKQFAHFTTAFNDDPASSAGYIYALGDPDPAVCSGDSGGPLYFQNGQVWELAGVVSAGNNNTESWFTRIGRVRNWIANPVSNDFRNGAMGSLLNRTGNNCITPRTSPEVAVLSYCDLRDIPNDPQYWRLLGNSSNGFKIENVETGKCLKATSTYATFASCNSTSTDLLWKFVLPVNANGATYYRIQNQSGSQRCITPSGSSSNGAYLALTTCSTSLFPNNQSFVFVP